MSYNVPSTQELAERNISQIESALNQTTPPAERAFNRVLATTEAMAEKGLYSFAADQIRENLALTASEEGLEKLGREYGIVRVLPAAWEGAAVFQIPDGETLYLGTAFIGPNGLKYETTASATAPHDAPGSGVVAAIACAEAGPPGSLSANAPLASQSGARRTGRVMGTAKLGTLIEDIELYRQRILDFERSEGGGGNSSDYRSWAQKVPGVRRAYPFSGPPEGSDHEPLPGERTVYVECDKSVNAEGLAPQPLLDLVKQALLADPDTGASRELLGLPGDLLYVRPIVRTGLYVTIIGMGITSGSRGAAEAALRSALEPFCETFESWVQGLDPDFERRDAVTASVIAREVQNVLDAYGGTAQNVLFGTSPGSFTGKYALRRNERTKLAGLAFLEAE